MICGNTEALARYERECEKSDRICTRLENEADREAADYKAAVTEIFELAKKLKEKIDIIREQDKIIDIIYDGCCVDDAATMPFNEFEEKYRDEYVEKNYDSTQGD